MIFISYPAILGDFFNEIPGCGVKSFHKKFNFQFPEGKFQVLMDAKKHL